MPEETPKKDTPAEDSSPTVTFHYIKSNLFRVIHADGAWGGITPKLKIQMALFSERNPIPQQTVQEVTEADTLGDERKAERVSRKGVIREVEAEVVMDVETAESLAEFLNSRVDEAKSIREKISNGSNPP